VLERFLSMGKRFVEIATIDGAHSVKLQCHVMTIPAPDSLTNGWAVSLMTPCASFLVRGPTENARLINIEFAPLAISDWRAPLEQFGTAGRAVLILTNGVMRTTMTISKETGSSPVGVRGEGQYFIPNEVLENANRFSKLYACATAFRLDTSVEVTPDEVCALGSSVHDLWCVLHGARPAPKAPFDIGVEFAVNNAVDRLPLSSVPAAIVVRGAVALHEQVMAAACLYLGTAERRRSAQGPTEQIWIKNPEHCLLFKETREQRSWSAKEFDARVRLAASAFAVIYVVIDVNGALHLPPGRPPSGSSLVI
jgi:hypothetical protein